jgi:hypothetical protein
MKTMNKTLAWMLAATFSLALISSAIAQDAKERTGKVVRLKGDARYSTGNKVWQPLKVGMVLKSGYIVQTAMNSFVDIVINEEATAAPVKISPTSSAPSGGAGGGGGGGGSAPTPDQDVVRVLDDTYVIFDSLTATVAEADTVTETMLDLRKGSIFANVKKQAAASRFEVKTTQGVAGIRGTGVLIKANGDVACVSGSAITAFADASGNATTKVVNAGEQFSAATGQTGAIAPGTLATLNGLLSQTSISADGQTAAAAAQGAKRKGPPGGAPVTYENTGEKVSRNLPSN